MELPTEMEVGSEMVFSVVYFCCTTVRIAIRLGWAEGSETTISPEEVERNINRSFLVCASGKVQTEETGRTEQKKTSSHLAVQGGDLSQRRRRGRFIFYPLLWLPPSPPWWWC